MARDAAESTGDDDADDAQRDADRDDADAWAARWGCPAAGHESPAELPRDLARVAKHVARLVGGEPARTCPFACLERAAPHVLDLTRAVALLDPDGDWVTGLRPQLGRDPNHFELQCLSQLRRSKAQAWTSDQEHRRREAEAEAKRRAGAP